MVFVVIRYTLGETNASGLAQVLSLLGFVSLAYLGQEGRVLFRISIKAYFGPLLNKIG